jgi:carboxyl-terminal processing protease
MNDPQLKKYFKYILFFGFCVLIFVFGFLFGHIVITNSSNTSTQVNPANQYLTGDTSGQKVGVNADIIWEAWNQLQSNYLNDQALDKQQMIYGAIKGIVASLNDPYTQFLTPQETTDYQQSSGGKFQGIGAQLRYNGEYTVIDTPIDDFPAQKAGLMAGDIILKVNDQDMHNKDANTVADLVKGPAGTTVKLTVLRPKDQKQLDFTITRAEINVDNVKLVTTKNHNVLVKIYRFTESDNLEFVSLWDKVVKQIQGSDINGVIIDLRNNPGGVVDLVRYVTQDFLKKGDLIMMEETKAGARTEYRAPQDGRLLGKKVVILVNEGSASASEIMSGALQDLHIATIVGMPTVGKGVEQTVIQLSDKSTMHIVFQRWLTPNGRQVTKDKPITPDVQVDLTTQDFEQGKDPQLDKAWELLGVKN